MSSDDTPRPGEITELNRRLIPALEDDGRIFITSTVLKGEFVIRACIINHRKTRQSIDYLLDVIREVGQSLLGTGLNCR